MASGHQATKSNSGGSKADGSRRSTEENDMEIKIDGK